MLWPGCSVLPFPGNSPDRPRDWGSGDITGRLAFRASFLKPALALAYRQADRVIGQSSFALQEIHTQLGVPQERLIRIANPVEVDALAPSFGSRQRVHSDHRPNRRSASIGWSRGPHLLGAGAIGN